MQRRTAWPASVVILKKFINFAIVKDKYMIENIKALLLDQLKNEHAFWSYAPESIAPGTMADDMLIAMTMRYLDLPQIKMLFKIYPYQRIKLAWKKHLVPEGEYLYTLNRFFAWYYFKAKRPDAYLKTLYTRHQNALLSKFA